MSTSATIAEEIASWKKIAPKSIQIVTATNQFVTFKYEGAKYVKAKVTFNFPNEYPTKAIIVTVEGLPPGLCKRLVREMEEVAQTNCPQPHIEPVAKHLWNFLDTNRFVPCWKEVRKLVDLSKQQQQQGGEVASPFSIVSLQDTKGAIRIKFTNGDYFYDCKLIINPDYPSTTNLEDPLQLQLVKTNFPKEIVESVLGKQAKGFLRCMQDGISEKEAWSRSNPIPPPNPPPTTTNEDGTGIPIPSLSPLVSLLETKIQQLPKTQCPVCETPVLPSNPNQLQALYDPTSKTNKEATLKKQKQPIYSSCGCWFHYKCLNTFLTEPPFGASCSSCGHRAYHPNWSADQKELERAYAVRQARQREMDDVAMMF